MKNFVICFAMFILIGSSCLAQDCNNHARGKAYTNKHIEFRMVKPLELVKGIGCYTLDVGKRVISGTNTILTAPLKSKDCLPKAKRYKWVPGKWVPGKLVPVLDPEEGMENLKIEIDDNPSQEKRTRGLEYPLYIHPKDKDNVA